MKKDTLIIYLLLIILLLLIYNTFFANKFYIKNDSTQIKSEQKYKDKKNIDNEVNPFLKGDLKAHIIINEDNTYGYQILYNGSPILYQPNIPSMPGKAGFKTKKNALKVCLLVISKIRNNQMPPTITIQELDSLKVL